MVTMKDVAQRAGVTERTVYNVLHKSKKVSLKTIEKVNKAIKELNYRESFVARSLVTGKTRSLGLLIPEADSSFFYNMFLDIENIAREMDYNVFVCITGNDIDELKYYLDMLYKRGVDGIILDYTDKVSFLKDYGIPVVSFNSFSKENPFCNCISNFSKSIKDAVIKLYNQNCRKFVFLYDDNILNQNARLIPYVEILTEFGLEAKYYPVSIGYERIFSEIIQDLPHAILSDADYFIGKLILYCMQKNIKIKEKVNLIGFDDFFVSGFLEFDTIQQDTKSMAKVLVDKLTAEIEGIKRDKQELIFDCNYIDRGTCKIKF